ncbi:MAG: HRDC domain-containing protein [Microbacteriaceae bacterium]
MSEEEVVEEPPPLPKAVLARPMVLVDNQSDFRLALDDLLSASGPLALDAERASGFRYSSRAYLVQAHRRGSANYLIDPLGVPDLSDITTELGDLEWILHAAHQDLPSLREIGVEPQILFDTELGARLAGLPRVGLQGVVEDILGLSLAKEHSAADWSTRPLPEQWLTYAALDVELLPAVRDEIHRILEISGKLDLAREEFAAQLTLSPTGPRAEPWRRLSGLHQIRGPKALAVARELWQAREEYAREIDTSPGRLVPDRSLVAALLANPKSKGELAGLKAFHGRASRSQLDRWWEAMERGKTTEDLPEARAHSEGPPPPRVWVDKNPEAHARFQAAKEALALVSEEHNIPSENLLTPDYLRRVCWEPPADVTEESIAHALESRGARAWQISLVAKPLTEAFVGNHQKD